MIRCNKDHDSPPFKTDVGATGRARLSVSPPPNQQTFSAANNGWLYLYDFHFLQSKNFILMENQKKGFQA